MKTDKNKLSTRSVCTTWKEAVSDIQLQDDTQSGLGQVAACRVGLVFKGLGQVPKVGFCEFIWVSREQLALLADFSVMSKRLHRKCFRRYVKTLLRLHQAKCTYECAVTDMGRSATRPSK